MRSRRTAVDHTEAVARRLAMLSAELDAAHREPPGGAATAPDPPALTRVSGSALPPEITAQAPWQPAPEDLRGPDAHPLPVPGRHAARRSGAGPVLPSAVLPTVVTRRWRAWAPAQVSIVLAGVVLALGVTCAWLLLGHEQPMVEPVAARQIERSAAPVVDTTPVNAPDGGGDVVVHVAGRVHRPGIVVLPAGARVGEAIEQAGGARKRKDTHGLNLARVLVDGEQVFVGPSHGGGGATAPGAPAPVAGQPVPVALVSINSADATTLETLPGVGPVTAAAIIEWRTRHGGFTAVEELLEVRGIGEATLEQMLALVTL